MTPTLPALVGLGARALIGAAVRLARRRRARSAPVSGPVSSPQVSSTPTASGPAPAPSLTTSDRPAASASTSLPPTPPAPVGCLLDADAPLGALARREPLPCCALVALWALARAGVALDLSGDAQRAYGAAVRHDGDWWAAANVWDAGDKWSAPRAVAAVLGGRVSDHGPAEALKLTPGRVHVVQRWSESGGHTYLVAVDADGVATRYESSVALGYRATRGVLWGVAEQGHEVVVATLPEGV